MPATKPEIVIVSHAGERFEVEVVRSAARRLSFSLQVKADGTALVRVPARATKASVKEFVTTKAGWLAGAVASAGATPPAAPEFEGATVPVWGEPHTIDVVPSPAGRPAVTVAGGRVEVRTPASADPRKAFAAWLAREAHGRLDELVARWAPVVGSSPRQVLVRNQRARWGSCTADGTLRFNWRLGMLEPWLVEGVVVHELCHLLVPNHSKAFWETVHRAQPDHEARRTRLKAVERSLPRILD